MADRSDRKPPAAPSPAVPAVERKSGRVQFDKRGHAVWEWAVRTGMYDRNASTQRVRALTEPSVKLEIADTLTLTVTPAPKPAAASSNPYERAASASRPDVSRGGDPDGRGSRPAAKPNPRPAPTRKP